MLLISFIPSPVPYATVIYFTSIYLTNPTIHLHHFATEGQLTFPSVSFIAGFQTDDISLQSKEFPLAFFLGRMC